MYTIWNYELSDLTIRGNLIKKIKTAVETERIDWKIWHLSVRFNSKLITILYFIRHYSYDYCEHLRQTRIYSTIIDII